ncbi:MAG TPA: carboxypeptidase regulatory-like domain-containing protein, partial [Longimicrobiales bacterium]|nr:carboxypeptidase regulatory-like domain-containing protein [Longimicrobiales bacterium]
MKRFKYLTLAALVAFAACDEGEDAPPQGTISGAVTIEGTGASGVTVSLSSGATTTTDGSGQYTFADVDAGSYTVTISGYPADATFTTTSQAAAITTADQVVTVNFSGTYVRTSAITGFVTAGGSPIQGVTVSIGSGTPTTQTDAGGQYSFSGLRAGTYTVTISGYDTNQYVFAQT